MTPKEFLSRYIEADNRIDQLLEEREVWQSRAEKMTSPIDAERVSGSKDGSPMDDAVDKVLEIDKEIRQAIVTSNCIKLQVMSVISSVGLDRYRKLLNYRYIGHKELGKLRESYSWTQIASKMSYDRRYIFKMHALALNIVSDSMKKDTKRHYHDTTEV